MLLRKLETSVKTVETFTLFARLGQERLCIRSSTCHGHGFLCGRALFENRTISHMIAHSALIARVLHFLHVSTEADESPAIRTFFNFPPGPGQ